MGHNTQKDKMNGHPNLPYFQDGEIPEEEEQRKILPPLPHASHQMFFMGLCGGWVVVCNRPHEIGAWNPINKPILEVFTSALRLW
jgi:hypothetical protein